MTGQQVGEALRGHKGWVNSVAFSPDGTSIVSGSFDETIRVWDVVTGKQVGEMGHENSVNSVAFSPDGTHIVSGFFDKTIRVWDAVTGQQVSEALRGHEDLVHSVMFSRGGTCIGSGSSDKTIMVWDAVQIIHLTCPQHHCVWFRFGKKETQPYILWIPHSLRRRDFIWYPFNMVITERPRIAVRFEEAAWGPDWAKIKK